ncbi:hypothetical protein AYI69_g6575 [Smittium culicis]|uniref:CCHC-type domain-containing protein n=1 Tax=Smittium culicis TaxID=133412 RepID=A0A1R1XYG5_9FUNG|nr:hypothetical protein AYI69_g6575 [Smittium culicis]
MTKESFKNSQSQTSSELIANSAEPIVLKKKGQAENKTPPQMEPDTGGKLENLFESLSISEKGVNILNKKSAKIKIETQPVADSSDSESDFSETEESSKVSTMPRPGSKNAPYFDGFDVSLFLNEMKQLAITANISTSQLASIIPRYCSPEIKTNIHKSYVFQVRNWKALREFMTETYTVEKKKVIKLENLERIISSEWNYENSFSLLSEFKLIAKGLLKQKMLTEDILVGMLRKILPDPFLQAGLLSQGDRKIKHMFISLEDAVLFVKASYVTIKEENELKTKANDEIKNVQFENRKYIPSNNDTRIRRCVYCDKEWHSRKDCIQLTEDITNKKVMFDNEGKISYINGKNVELNYEKGGMKALVDSKVFANLLILNQNDNISESIYDEQNYSIDVNSNAYQNFENDFDIMMTKRQLQRNETNPRKKQHTQVMHEFSNSETEKNTYPIGHKIGLPIIDNESNNNLVEATLNTIIPVTVRQLIKSDSEFRKAFVEVIKQRKIPIQGPMEVENEPISHTWKVELLPRRIYI